jgi:NitT/TauT family transport system permease protein
VLGAVAAVFWLAVWQVVSLLVAEELLVPSPLVVLSTLARLAATPEFWVTTGWSLLRMGAGFLAGVVTGCLAAALTTSSRVADALLSPLLRVVRAAPVASFVILALVWIPTGRLPAFIAFLMVVPVVWDTMAEGLRRPDAELLEMAAVFRFGRWQTLRRIRIPSLLPFFVTACTTGMGLAWKSGVAAEVIARPELSIGGELQDAKIYLETPAVFAWTITAVTLSLALEGALRAATARWAARLGVAGRPSAAATDVLERGSGVDAGV